MLVTISDAHAFGVAGALKGKDGVAYAMAAVVPKGVGTKKGVNRFFREGGVVALKKGDANEGLRIREMQKVAEKSDGRPEWETTLEIYYDLSVVAPSEKEQVFIFPGKLDEEQIGEKVREEFFRNRFKDLPIPVEQDWEEYLWKQISSGVEILTPIGDVAWSGAKLTLNFQGMREAVTRAHAAAEFKELKGRVPMIADLLDIMDVQGFNPKNWQQFMGAIGGKEAFLGMSRDHRKMAVGIFEVMGPETGAEIFTWLKNQGVNDVQAKSGQLWLRLKAGDNNRRQAFRSAIARVAKHFKETPIEQSEDGYELTSPKDYVSRVITMAGEIFDKQGQNISNENWPALRKFLEKIIYGDSEGVEDLAEVCGRAGVSQHDWPKYRELWTQTIKKILMTAKEYPTISNDLDDEWGWELIDMSDPRAWVVGIETYCCQHLGGAGGDCVEYAAQNPATSGILRVYRKDRTMAQSFVWLGENRLGTRTLVLDNIEAAGRDLPEKVIACYRDFAKHLEKYARLFGISAVTVGQGYLEGWLRELAPSKADKYFGAIPRTLGYTDARNQKLLTSYTWSTEEK